jgi:2-phospho-L-lactate guanylyltransferase
MTLWAAIPVKPLWEGKSRLAAALSPQARERLNGILFRQTLDAVVAVFATENVIVITRDAGLREQAVLRGCKAIAEHGNNLNGALNEALGLAGSDGLLAISTDLPDVTPDDVRAMLAGAERPGPVVKIAPDRARRGTNALFTAPAGRIPFRFGEDSFAAHLAEARHLGIEPEIVLRPALAFDLDLPEDLHLCSPGWFSLASDLSPSSPAQAADPRLKLP